MSTTQPPLRDELTARYNCLDTTLQRTVGMSARRFKQIKALTQFVGMATGAYGMYLGGDPLLMFAMMMFLWGGPEALEHALESAGSAGSATADEE